jgi:hypothetical protein
MPAFGERRVVLAPGESRFLAITYSAGTSHRPV